MVVKVYCGNDFEDYEHEWDQFCELIEKIKEEYDVKKESVYICGNVTIKSNKLDVILFTNKGIAIIDLKNYKGKVMGKENGDWELETENGEKVKIHTNVFDQLSGYRKKLFGTLKGLINKTLPDIDEKNLWKIKCWGYFRVGSSYDKDQLITYSNTYWFDIITKENILEKLRFLKNDYYLTNKVIEDTIKVLGSKNKCKGLTINGLNEYKYRKINKEESRKARKEKLKKWINSEYKSDSNVIYSKATREKVRFHQLEVIDKTDDVKERNFLGWETREKKGIEIIEWLEKKPEKIILIKGEPGSGKSSTMKYYYERLLEEYKTDKNDKFPIQIDLSNIDAEHSINEELEEKYGNILEEINDYKSEGKIVLIIDSWDELPPNKRIETERYFSNALKYGNKLIVSSRILNEDDLPKFTKYQDKRNKEEINIYDYRGGEILPLKDKDLDGYFKARYGNLKPDEIRRIKHLITKSRIKTTALWMDLVISFTRYSNEENFEEINLLAHWIRELIERTDKIENVEEKLEEIAYKTYVDETYKITKQTAKTLIKSVYFGDLEKHGWIVPAGFSKNDRKYTFAHETLREYLAARYICHNWKRLENNLFERTTGILSNREYNKLIILALKEAKRLDFDTEEFKSRIYQIAGEDNWFSGEKISYGKLRDPILALKIHSELELEETKIIQKLKELLVKVYDLITNQKKLSKEKQIISNWFNKEEVIETLASSLPDLFIEKIYQQKPHFYPSSLNLGKEATERLFKTMIGKWPDDPSILLDALIDIKSYQSSGLTTNNKWLQDSRDIIKYVENNPEIMLDNDKKRKCKKETVEFHLSSTYLRIIDYVMEIIRKNDLNEYSAILNKWTDSDHEMLKTAAFRLFEISRTYDNYSEKLFLKLCRKWLNSDDTERRKTTIQKIFRSDENFVFDKDKLLNEELEQRDYEYWLESIKLEQSTQKCSYNGAWLKKEREKLIKWLCEKYTLRELKGKLQLKYNIPLFKKILQNHKGVKDIEEAKNILLYISVIEKKLKVLTQLRSVTLLSTISLGGRFINLSPGVNKSIPW